MTAGPTASALAAGKVASVRDSPRGRLELLAKTYDGPSGSAPHHRRFRRIVPRLQRLYEWSALELGQPRLTDLIEDGSPTYAWPLADRDVWRSTRGSIPEKLLTRLTS
jgi:hypothetical protein